VTLVGNMELSLPKMLSGTNAFEINEIQEDSRRGNRGAALCNAG
jgi:hypothetical protein